MMKNDWSDARKSFLILKTQGKLSQTMKARNVAFLFFLLGVVWTVGTFYFMKMIPHHIYTVDHSAHSINSIKRSLISRFVDNVMKVNQRSNKGECNIKDFLPMIS